MRSPTIAAGLIVLLAAALACDGSVSHEGMDPSVARRHVVLDGAFNFRDLGGYATEDGRSVRWGRIFRSDQLADLSDGDLEVLSELGIRLVCDFRSPDERAEQPDRLPANDPPAVAELGIYDDSFDPNAIREAIVSGELDDVDFGQLLVDGNRTFVVRFSPQFASMFERLAQPENLPALVHCTAGKDRAGFASAIILRALGVPEETVFEDFLLTNHYTADRIERRLLMIRAASLFRADPEKVRPLLGVERAYLRAAFDEIEARYGCFNRYLREALGVGDRELASLRANLLE